MLARLQWVIIADKEEAHGGYQELKQLHQGGVAPIWPYLHPSHSNSTVLTVMLPTSHT